MDKNNNYDDLMKAADALAKLNAAQKELDQIMWENSLMGRIWKFLGPALLVLFFIASISLAVWLWFF